ncbi:uncharacterized protein LOC132714051 [Ruditapes philippinarum]|uniref:uncharacterized protein LOC132714051 n=1 Tax=Ruditapes philippinarum TaxID=129788 RepID=UPI00295A89FF|nr:uncharacterized protein LOC132714051 [Ruditapes philippinarum]
MDSHICYLFVVIMSGFATIYGTNVLTTMKVSNDTTIKTTMKTSTFGQNLNTSIDTTEPITTDKNKSEAVDNEVHACNDTDETASRLSSAFPMTQNTSQTSFSVRMEDATASGLGMLFSRGQTRTTIKVTSIRSSSKITNDKSTASVNQSSQIETQTNTSAISGEIFYVFFVLL